jgi:drug/metabolite transporter (DMT)-like permease
LYVVIVPILGLLFRQKTGLWTWVGASLGAVGLYFLSMSGRMGLSPGDGFVLIGSFVWAGHVIAIGRLSRKIEPLILALIQFAICSALSFVCWVVTEDASIGEILLAAIPILYGGIMSVGIAFTLQVVAQRDAHPAHAAIIMSLEAVFAALGGWMILGETLSGRSLAGCALMLAGMIISSRKQT